jgi:hypothetical protein
LTQEFPGRSDRHALIVYEVRSSILFFVYRRTLGEALLLGSRDQSGPAPGIPWFDQKEKPLTLPFKNAIFNDILKEPDLYEISKTFWSAEKLRRWP